MASDDVMALQHENEQLRAALDGARSQRRRRLRSVTSVVLAVLAVVATTLALLGVWTFRTMTNTELFVERIGPVIEDPDVAAAVSQAAAEQVVTAIDLEGRLEQRLPSELGVAVQPITSAAQNLLAEGVTRLQQTDQFETAFDATLTATHKLAIGVLSGTDREAVSTDDGAVVLDLTPVINQLITEGSDFLSGALDRDIPAPQVTPDNVDAAVAAIEDRLGVDVPADFGQVTLFESAELAQAQQAYQVVRWSVILAPILALALIGLAVAVSLRRVRTLLGIVVGVALGLLLVALAAQPLKASLLEAVSTEGLAPAVSGSFDIVFSTLRLGVLVVTVLGVIAAFALFISGESRAARSTRHVAGQAPSLAARYRTAFLVAGAVVVLALLAVIPGRSWVQLGVGLLLYAAFALAVVLAPRPAPDTSDAEALV
jgi:hypothetical protein